MVTPRNLNYTWAYTLLDSTVLDQVLSIKDINVKTKGKVSVSLKSAFDCWWGGR